MEEESYALEESEQQVKDKDEDAVTENSGMIKATKKPAKAGASGKARGRKAKEGTSTEAPTAKGKGKGKNRK